ncbi:hypothetical protein [Halonotius pteroides]|uniref:hypothetical protein n=1 Tax=Halonotius pteroides TaxID=268735 RepID=UPI001058F1BD|nr:hypothetical protein [Halonotius pteroides]
MRPSQPLLTTGRRRGVAADTVILVIDDRDVPLLSPTEESRLPTVPAEPQADRQFATLLGGVDETIYALVRPDVSQRLEARAKSVAVRSQRPKPTTRRHRRTLLRNQRHPHRHFCGSPRRH